jgi:hypothetical protein
MQLCRLKAEKSVVLVHKSEVWIMTGQRELSLVRLEPWFFKAAIVCLERTLMRRVEVLGERG